jgi:hypothetical protein
MTHPQKTATQLSCFTTICIAFDFYSFAHAQDDRKMPKVQQTFAGIGRLYGRHVPMRTSVLRKA